MAHFSSPAYLLWLCNGHTDRHRLIPTRLDTFLYKTKPKRKPKQQEHSQRNPAEAPITGTQTAPNIEIDGTEYAAEQHFVMIKQNVAFSSVQDTASYPWCRKPRGSRGVGGVGGAPCGGRRTWTIDQPRAAELRGTGQQRGVAGRLRPAPRRPRTASRLFPELSTPDPPPPPPPPPVP